jgi:hypothetical protein
MVIRRRDSALKQCLPFHQSFRMGFDSAVFRVLEASDEW